MLTDTRSIYTPLFAGVLWDVQDYLMEDIDRIDTRTEVSLVGRNLLHARHLEFGTPAARGELERSVYGKIAWRF